MELIQLGQAHGARVDKLIFMDAADLAERFLPSRLEPPFPVYTDTDARSLWTFQAATARYQAIREPDPSACLRLQFDANGAVVDTTTPASIQDKFAEGMSAVPPANWAESIKAPRLGIFAFYSRPKRGNPGTGTWCCQVGQAGIRTTRAAHRRLASRNHREVCEGEFGQHAPALPGAPHYVFIDNEAEVVRWMWSSWGYPKDPDLAARWDAVLGRRSSVPIDRGGPCTIDLLVTWCAPCPG
jgi:hypothetical protein